MSRGVETEPDAEIDDDGCSLVSSTRFERSDGFGFVDRRGVQNVSRSRPHVFHPRLLLR